MGKMPSLSASGTRTQGDFPTSNPFVLWWMYTSVPIARRRESPTLNRFARGFTNAPCSTSPRNEQNSPPNKLRAGGGTQPRSRSSL